MAVVEGVWATVNPSLVPFLGLSGNRQVFFGEALTSERGNSSTFADRSAPACRTGETPGGDRRITGSRKRRSNKSECRTTPNQRCRKPSAPKLHGLRDAAVWEELDPGALLGELPAARCSIEPSRISRRKYYYRTSRRWRFFADEGSVSRQEPGIVLQARSLTIVERSSSEAAFYGSSPLHVLCTPAPIWEPFPPILVKFAFSSLRSKYIIRR